MTVLAGIIGGALLGALAALLGAKVGHTRFRVEQPCCGDARDGFCEFHAEYRTAL